MENVRRGASCGRPSPHGQTPGLPLQIFFRDIKFEHSLFALPFAYLGLFLAEGGLPRFPIFLWVTLAMVGFRTFGMAVNRLIDSEIDSQNPRTRGRALPQKKLKVRFVLIGAGVSLVIFLFSAWKLGPVCFFLTPVPIFLAVLYPYLKRFTWFSHAVLGIILGIAPYGAWLAGRGEPSWIPGLLMLGIASWVAGFDILYSLQDFEFDQDQKLHSIPVRFGKEQALNLAGGLHAAALLAWTGAGFLAQLKWAYGAGLLAAALLFFREHWIIRRFGLAKMDQAFFTMNASVSVVIFAAAALDLYWGG